MLKHLHSPGITISSLFSRLLLRLLVPTQNSSWNSGKKIILAGNGATSTTTVGLLKAKQGDAAKNRRDYRRRQIAVTTKSWRSELGSTNVLHCCCGGGLFTACFSASAALTHEDTCGFQPLLRKKVQQSSAVGGGGGKPNRLFLRRPTHHLLPD